MRNRILVSGQAVGATVLLIGCPPFGWPKQSRANSTHRPRRAWPARSRQWTAHISTALTSGVADRSTGATMTDNERVRIGSVTKTFTAAIGMQLVAEGSITLDSLIDNYLPGVVAGDGVDGHAITVRQILQHRSGIPEFTGQSGADEVLAATEDTVITPSETLAIALGDRRRLHRTRSSSTPTPTASCSACSSPRSLRVATPPH